MPDPARTVEVLEMLAAFGLFYVVARYQSAPGIETNEDRFRGRGPVYMAVIVAMLLMSAGLYTVGVGWFLYSVTAFAGLTFAARTGRRIPLAVAPALAPVTLFNDLLDRRLPGSTLRDVYRADRAGQLLAAEVKAITTALYLEDIDAARDHLHRGDLAYEAAAKALRAGGGYASGHELTRATRQLLADLDTAADQTEAAAAKLERLAAGPRNDLASRLAIADLARAQALVKAAYIASLDLRPAADDLDAMGLACLAAMARVADADERGRRAIATLTIRATAPCRPGLTVRRYRPQTHHRRHLVTTSTDDDPDPLCSVGAVSRSISTLRGGFPPST